MSKLQRLCAAITLLALLSISASAGEISTGVVSPPPPPASALTASGDTAIDETEVLVQPNDIFVGITLNLLQLLSVF